jgi:hypothetical protein
MYFPALNSELGPVTVASHVVAKARDCPEILAAAARHNPFVPVLLQNGRMKIGTVFNKTRSAIKRVCQKKAIILAHQELELVEILCAHYRAIHLNIMADATIPPAVLARMRNNLPSRCCAEIIQIPNLPKRLQPSEAVILAVGALAGGGYVLLHEHTLNTLEHLCRFFWGEVMLIDPVGYPIQDRADDCWLLVEGEKFFTGVASSVGYKNLEAVKVRSAA